MARSTPTNQESRFSIDELFFSKTDSRGIILAGNEVFVRVSGYPRQEMYGAPHNLIRHPDMPRCVFKLFWETIQKDQPIGAYVKNMAANGAFYWVFACAFPVEGGYLSIRLKPSTAFLALMPGIYSELLRVERGGEGMEGGVRKLLEILKDKGYDSYQAFMTDALTQELRARAVALEGRKTRVFSESRRIDGSLSALMALAARSGDAAHAYASIFERLDRFAQGSRTFEQQTATILKAYRELGLLSFNMAIAADSAGEQGRTLAVVASTFQKMASEIQGQLAQFQESMQRLTVVIQDSRFRIAAACLQTEMTAFFVRELVAATESGKQEGGVEEFRKSCTELLALAGSYSEQARQGILQLQALLRRFTNEREELEASVVGLEVIRQSGTVESSRSNELKAAFGAHIERMRNFVLSVKEPTRSVGDTLVSLLIDVQDTQSLISSVLETFRQASAALARV
ncbi:MAG: PAS domain-containing protein [Oligoflexia bacterium]|nr:PAS domain-containing protein [Oligoflexia bacterium]